MNRTLLLSLVALAFSGFAQAATINLVTNGSFEQGLAGLGSFTGWQTVLGDSDTFVDSSGQTGTHYGQASDGLWSAYLGSLAADGGSSLSQTLVTAINQTYSFSFDVANDNAGLAPSNSFRATLGSGSSQLAVMNLPAQNYVHEQFLFVASSTATVLTFAGYNNTSYLELDNVLVTPVPEPSVIALMLCGSAMAAFFAVNRRRSLTS